MRVPVVEPEVGKGVGVYVWIDDEKLLIDFASVHTAELSRSGVWGKVSTAFLGRGTIKTIKVSNGLRSESSRRCNRKVRRHRSTWLPRPDGPRRGMSHRPTKESRGG